MRREIEMSRPQETGGKGEVRPHLPKDEDDPGRVLSESKLGVAQPDDPAGQSDEQALSKSKLGSADDGGRRGQGGMRDPAKTSGPARTKPS
jgi:hypothetical protein